jgi:hypothetical protein
LLKVSPTLSLFEMVSRWGFRYELTEAAAGSEYVEAVDILDDKTTTVSHSHRGEKVDCPWTSPGVMAPLTFSRVTWPDQHGSFISIISEP